MPPLPEVMLTLDIKGTASLFLFPKVFTASCIFAVSDARVAASAQLARPRRKPNEHDTICWKCQRCWSRWHACLTNAPQESEIIQPTCFNPLCVSAEHSRYLTALILLASFCPCSRLIGDWPASARMDRVSRSSRKSILVPEAINVHCMYKSAYCMPSSFLFFWRAWIQNCILWSWLTHRPKELAHRRNGALSPGTTWTSHSRRRRGWRQRSRWGRRQSAGTTAVSGDRSPPDQLCPTGPEIRARRHTPEMIRVRESARV